MSYKPTFSDYFKIYKLSKRTFPKSEKQVTFPEYFDENLNKFFEENKKRTSNTFDHKGRGNSNINKNKYSKGLVSDDKVLEIKDKKNQEKKINIRKLSVSNKKYSNKLKLTKNSIFSNNSSEIGKLIKDFNCI